MTYEYCGFTRWDWMESLAAILVRRAAVGNHIRRWGWDELPTEYKLTYKDRDHNNYRTWFEREYNGAPIHPAIREAVYQAPPADWHLLVLEHPHASDSDPSRIAYTRSDEHGYADRQTVTSVGKYLARHFPTLAAHRLRDIVMRHGPHRFEMWDTVEKIVKSVQDGPQSCMRWGGHSPSDTHPYEVYAPEYGWRAAVRLDGSGTINARCLVNVESMTFVRSYTRKDGEYSHSDEAIEVWLRDQGFEKDCDWVGLKLKRITKHRHDDDFWAPYLDGDCKNVEDRGTHLLIDNSGDYECDRTDGHATGSSSCTCNDCGDRHGEDEMYSVGYHGDYSVGPCCIDSYTLVLGRNGCEYYIPENDAIYVESTNEHYDPDHLSRYDIIELDNGDYVHQDDAIYLEYRDIWVESDSDDAVYCEHSGVYEHIGDCVRLHNDEWALECDVWQCEHDDAWYLSDEESFVTPCGKTVHEKYKDEYATETNNEEN